MNQWLKDIKNNETGAGLVEYALLIALVAVMAIPSVAWLGENVGDNMQETGIFITGGDSIECGPPPLDPC